MTSFWITPFYRLPAAERSLFLTLLLLLFCGALFVLLVMGAQRQRKSTLAGALIPVLLLFGLLVWCGAEHQAVNQGLPVYVPPLPFGAACGLAVLAGAYVAVAAGRLAHSFRKKLGHGSIKEAFDTLPVAVCYFTDAGRVKLCNHKMYALCRSLLGCDLQMLSELHTALERCGEQGVVTQAFAGEGIYRFPDGTAWRYTENCVTVGEERYTEALFSDVTDLCRRRLELEEQTAALRQASHRIRELSQNVQAMTKEKETLNYKTWLHNRMGEALVAFRQCIRQHRSLEEVAPAVEKLRKTVQLFANSAASEAEDGGWGELVCDASVIGVTVALTGTLPQSREALRLALMAVRECLTNAVRHAGATELYVVAGETDGAAVLRITNNGAAPEDEVTPGGGLHNLERQLLAAGGSLAVQSAPVFELTVTIPL